MSSETPIYDAPVRPATRLAYGILLMAVLVFGSMGLVYGITYTTTDHVHTLWVTDDLDHTFAVDPNAEVSDRGYQDVAMMAKQCKGMKPILDSAMRNHTMTNAQMDKMYQMTRFIARSQQVWENRQGIQAARAATDPTYKVLPRPYRDCNPFGHNHIAFEPEKD